MLHKQAETNLETIKYMIAGIEAALDELKREHPGIRAAIEYLENAETEGCEWMELLEEAHS